jgi:hypothetical protein
VEGPTVVATFIKAVASRAGTTRIWAPLCSPNIAIVVRSVRPIKAEAVPLMCFGAITGGLMIGRPALVSHPVEHGLSL